MQARWIAASIRDRQAVDDCKTKFDAESRTQIFSAISARGIMRMTGRCNDVRDELAAYLSGENNTGEREVIRAHLETCGGCRGEAAAQTQTARQPAFTQSPDSRCGASCPRLEKRFAGMGSAGRPQARPRSDANGAGRSLPAAFRVRGGLGA